MANIRTHLYQKAKLLQRSPLTAFITVFVIVGCTVLLVSRASGTFIAVEPEAGTLSGVAAVGSDASASGGHYLQFGASQSSKALHYTANTGGSVGSAASAGFNVFDVAGSTTNPAGVKTTVDALPVGAQALVWVGNLDNAPLGSACPTPGFTLAQFQAQVNALAGDGKVYGYYISDEPHPSVCPNAASDIKARADYVRQVAPAQKSFIVVLDGSNACGTTMGCEFRALAPGNTDVDLVGVDPYPCHFDATGNAVPCDTAGITARVNAATSNGVAASQIVPVFQTFGQEGRTDGKQIYYRTPSAGELSSMLATWAALVPHPVMDYSYTWGVQCTVSSCPAAQALANHPELQAVIQAHNAQ